MSSKQAAFLVAGIFLIIAGLTTMGNASDSDLVMTITGGVVVFFGMIMAAGGGTSGDGPKAA